MRIQPELYEESKLKAELDLGDQKVEIDFSEAEKRITEKLGGQMKQYFKELTEWRKDRQERGKGVVEMMKPDAKAAVVEEFQKGERCNPQKIKEQWTIAVPKFARYELAGHLRDYVWVTDVVKGKPGETVNIPYVNDIDFQIVTAKTGTFTAKTDLVNVLTTTLKEAGAYYDAYYGDIEKIDSNLLDELNRVFAHAAIRAEDVALLTLINTATTGQFLSEGGGTDVLSPMVVGTLCDSLDVDLIFDAIAALMQRGKEVHPGECILVMTPLHWGALMGNLAGSAAVMQGRPDIVQKGMVEEFLGVKLVVTHDSLDLHIYQTGGATSYSAAYLMRPKRALALAPKRDILIETDKLIATRQLRIAASHTFGVAAIDYSEVVPILSCDAGIA